MKTVLGKRKSRSTATASEAEAGAKPAISAEEAQAIFRRHFESQFLPLDDGKPEDPSNVQDEENNTVEDLRSDDEDEDEWDGVSEADETSGTNGIVRVVDYSEPSTTLNPLAAALAKREAKAYLSSKVPLSSTASAADAGTAKPKPKPKTPTEEDSTDLLKNDLALQRLLSESHLFNPSKQSSSLIGSEVTTEHSGRNRHLATDMRMTALGGKGSIFKQEKMPMSHRKGIEGAKQSRDSKRRKDAKENGIILEKEVKKVKRGGGSSTRREKAVDAPAVGKMSNGMLRLSERDVAEIQGPIRSKGGKSRKRR